MDNPFSFWFVHIYVQFVVMPALILYMVVTGETNAYYGVRHICDFHKVTFARLKSSPSLVPGCVYLCNHRSWADFFIDQTLCGGAAYLSRKMVIIGTPMSCLWAWLSYSTWFFTRKPGIDRIEFAKWIEAQWNLRPNYGLIVYPEGTRNSKMEPMPLKTGALQYAYIYKKPVQIVITANKEKVVNEKTFRVNYGVFCVTNHSAVLDPSDYATFDIFKETVREKFTSTWTELYENCESNTKIEMFDPPFGIKKPEFEKVPHRSRLWIIRFILMCFTVFVLRKRIPFPTA